MRIAPVPVTLGSRRPAGDRRVWWLRRADRRQRQGPDHGRGHRLHLQGRPQRGGGRDHRVHGQEHRVQGQRVLRLRRGRPDHRRGREHHARPDPQLPRRGRHSRDLPDGLQAGHEGQGHPGRLHGHRHRRQPGARRGPAGSREAVPGVRQRAVRPPARPHDGLRRRGEGRQGRRGQGELRAGSWPVGADRAGRRVVR